MSLKAKWILDIERSTNSEQRFINCRQFSIISLQYKLNFTACFINDMGHVFMLDRLWFILLHPTMLTHTMKREMDCFLLCETPVHIHSQNMLYSYVHTVPVWLTQREMRLSCSMLCFVSQCFFLLHHILCSHKAGWHTQTHNWIKAQHLYKFLQNTI